MSHDHNVKDLIQIANDGASFYERATEKVQNPELRRVFSDMGQHKRDLVASLGTQLDDRSPSDVGGTVVGTFHRAYTELLAAVSSNDEKVYVSQLEETEDRLLAGFREAIEDEKDPKIKTILQDHLPRVIASHNEMRQLKQKMAA